MERPGRRHRQRTRGGAAALGAALALTMSPELRADPPPAAPPPAPSAGAPPADAPARPDLPPGYFPGQAPMPYAPPGYPGGSYPPPGWAPPGYAPYAQAAPSGPDPYTLPPPLPHRRRDMKLFVGGIVAVTGGMAAVLLGSYFVSSGVGRIEIYCDTPSVPCAYKNDAPRMTGGAVLMVAGALAGVAGIPMWLVGSEYVVIPKGDPQRPTALAPGEPRVAPRIVPFVARDGGERRVGATAELRF